MIVHGMQKRGFEQQNIIKHKQDNVFLPVYNTCYQWEFAMSQEELDG